MYLTSRLIGVFTYSILLLTFYLLIYKVSKKDLGKLLFIYTIILSIMAFKFIPAEGNDLYRLIDVMHYYSSQNIDQIIDSIINSSTPTQVIYYYIIGNLNLDGFLSGITAFIFYSNTFYILKDFAIRYNIPSKYTALSLLILMSTGSYMEVISGIRTMLGMSIVAVCVYKELIQDKNIFKNLIWYVIAILIHPAVLATVMIRFIFMIFEKSKTNKINKNKYIIFVIGIVIVLIYGVRYIDNMYDKVIEYLTTENGHFYIWEFLIGIIDLSLILIITKSANLNNKNLKYPIGFNNILKFLNIINCIVIIFMFIEYNTFHRFIIFSSMLVGPILMMSLKYSKNSNVIYKLTFFGSMVMLCIACTRGNLCSLKFFI